MFSVEASREIQFRIFHRVGTDQYVVTLQLQSGDDVQTRVLQAFRQGRLPSCLYKPTLEYAVLAVRESLSDHEQPQAGPIQASVSASALTSPSGGASPTPALSFAGGPSALGDATHLVASSAFSALVPRSGATAASGPGCSALAEELLALEERRWPRLLACQTGRRTPGRQATFWCAYDFLLRHRPAFFRIIGTLEESYLKGIRELQAGRLGAISELQRCQSMEMEKVRQQTEDSSKDGVENDVQSLVAQHVSEIDALEIHWRTEIEELKIRQKASYCDLIVDFFEQEVEQIWDNQEGTDGDTGPVPSRDGAGGSDGGGGGEGPAAEVVGEPFTPPPRYAGGSREVLNAQQLASPLRPQLASPLRPHPNASPAAASNPLTAASDATAAAGPSEEPSHGGTAGASSGTGGTVDDGRRGSATVPAATTAATVGRWEGRLQACAEVRAVFGQRCVFFVVRLLVGDIMDLMHDGPEGRDGWFTSDDGDGAGPQLPPEHVGLESYGHRYFARASGLPIEGGGWPSVQSAALRRGAERVSSGEKRPKGSFRSPSLSFWAAPSLPPPVCLSPNAYADSLRGLIIPTPENQKFEASQAVMLREFNRRCDQVTDLHFASLANQLQDVRASTAEAPLRIGDYFCTRHSNLGGVVQVAFHLLTGSSEAHPSDEVPAVAHRALKRIVCDCHRCRVAELSLPLLLLDIGTSESSLPYALAQRRAENALRALKGALTRLAEELAPSEMPELRVLNLVLPPSCAQSIGSGIPSVVETTRTFLRHSFQCV